MSEVQKIIMGSTIAATVFAQLGCARAVEGFEGEFAESGDFGVSGETGDVHPGAEVPPEAPSVLDGARLRHLGVGAGVSAPTLQRAFFGARPMGGASRIEGEEVWLKPWFGTVGGTQLTIAGAVGSLDGEGSGWSEGTRAVTLRIYDSPGLEATSLLTSAQLSVEVFDGVFHAPLPDPLSDMIMSDGGSWIRWSFDGDALEPAMEAGMLPFAGHVLHASAQQIYPEGALVPTQAFAAPPVLVVRGAYHAGDLVDAGTPAGWACSHEARVIGGTRLLVAKMVPTAHCGQDATFELQRSTLTVMADAHVGGGHPEIICTSGDDDCERRVSVIARYRGTQFSCSGVPLGQLPVSYFESTAPVVLAPNESESDHYTVNVVSTCHPA